MCCISASLAKISPSTRMFGRNDFGMRQQHASTCSSGPVNDPLAPITCSSNVDDHFRQPGAIGPLLDLKAVVRDRLDFIAKPVPVPVKFLAPRLALQTRRVDLHREAAEQKVVGV